MNHATSFDDVSYFRNQFRGDLIVTPGVLYYFPHTNVAAAKLERKARPTEQLGIVSHLFGLPGIAFQLTIDTLFDVSRFVWRTVRITTNQPKLREVGLWREDESGLELQQRLDAHIADIRRQSSSIVRYEYSLPKPIRFNQTDIRNLRLSMGTLRFDTEFDRHEFRIGFRRARLLRDVLWQSGFRSDNESNQSLNRSGVGGHAIRKT